MYGKAADTSDAAATTANARAGQRAASPHSRSVTTANAPAATATLSTPSSLIPMRAASG
jgi:hypothetical protein